MQLQQDKFLHGMILIQALFIVFRCSAVVMVSKETSVNEYGKACSKEDPPCFESFCPLFWTLKGQHCFFWSQDSDYETVTWEHAEDYCQNFGAHLASVATSDVYEYMRSKILKDTWIGATNQTENGTWVWTDCSSFNSEAPSEGNGRCAHLTADGHGSNDKDCGQKLLFVCSKPLCPGDSGRSDKAYSC